MRLASSVDSAVVAATDRARDPIRAHALGGPGVGKALLRTRRARMADAHASLELIEALRPWWDANRAEEIRDTAARYSRLVKEG